MGGGKRIIGGGGPKPFWGGVLWYVLPSHEFSTPPLFFSLKEQLRGPAAILSYLAMLVAIVGQVVLQGVPFTEVQILR